MIELSVNGRKVQSGSDPSTPLLWFLRDELGLTGTKFGCGAGLCGACTIHLNGRADTRMSDDTRGCSRGCADYH